MESQIAADRMVSIETTVTMNKVTDSFLSDITESEWRGRGLIIAYEIVSIRRVTKFCDAHAYEIASSTQR